MESLILGQSRLILTAFPVFRRGLRRLLTRLRRTPSVINKQIPCQHSGHSEHNLRFPGRNPANRGFVALISPRLSGKYQPKEKTLRCIMQHIVCVVVSYCTISGLKVKTTEPVSLSLVHIQLLDFTFLIYFRPDSMNNVPKPPKIATEPKRFPIKLPALL